MMARRILFMVLIVLSITGMAVPVHAQPDFSVEVFVHPEVILNGCEPQYSPSSDYLLAINCYPDIGIAKFNLLQPDFPRTTLVEGEVSSVEIVSGVRSFIYAQGTQIWEYYIDGSQAPRLIIDNANYIVPEEQSQDPILRKVMLNETYIVYMTHFGIYEWEDCIWNGSFPVCFPVQEDIYTIHRVDRYSGEHALISPEIKVGLAVDIAQDRYIQFRINNRFTYFYADIETLNTWDHAKFDDIQSPDGQYYIDGGYEYRFGSAEEKNFIGVGAIGYSADGAYILTMYTSLSLYHRETGVRRPLTMPYDSSSLYYYLDQQRNLFFYVSQASNLHVVDLNDPAFPDRMVRQNVQTIFRKTPKVLYLEYADTYLSYFKDSGLSYVLETPTEYYTTFHSSNQGLYQSAFARDCIGCNQSLHLISANGEMLQVFPPDTNLGYVYFASRQIFSPNDKIMVFTKDNQLTFLRLHLDVASTYFLPMVTR